MNYREGLLYLQSVTGETQKLSLEIIRKIVDALPAGIKTGRYIQVGGTNGKGSTSTFIAEVLRCSGFRTGLFTSPHLQDVRERIVFNGRMISRRSFAASLTMARSLCERLVEDHDIPSVPTFFEYIFLTALVYFARRRTQWVVLEVGLGGRLDATTTVLPRLTVITNIGFDHMNILGSTIEQIAREKAGIIRPGVPVVCGSDRESTAYEVLDRDAREKCAPFYPVFGGGAVLTSERRRGGHACLYRWNEKQLFFFLTIPGSHQCRNAAVAIRALDVLVERQELILSRAAIQTGLKTMFIPGRIEIFPRQKNQPRVILDGGHNPDGIRSFAEYLQNLPQYPYTLIFGVLQDKEYEIMAKIIAPFASSVILVMPRSHRALDPKELNLFFPDRHVYIEKKISRAWEIAKKIKKDIIITGSLYLVGEIRTLMLRRKPGE